MDKNIPKFDLPVDFIIADHYTGEEISRYKGYPYKLEAGVFILITRGTAQVSINLKEYSLKEYDFITLIPENLIQIHEISPDIHMYVTGFSSKLISNISLINTIHTLLPVITDNPVIGLSPTGVPPFENIYKAFIDAYKPEENKEIIVKTIISLMAQGIYEIYKKKFYELQTIKPKREQEIYKEFVQLVMDNYKAEHGVNFYAEKLRITLPHFSTSIRKASGRKPLEIISSFIILDAKTQLKTTNIPIKNIAMSLGFGNLSFFNKYFKRYTGMTPNGYREQRSL